MNGQHACCALGLCCKKKSDQIRALVEMVKARDIQLKDAEDAVLERFVEAMLEEFDLVPVGVGAAIINAYEPQFRQLAKGIKGVSEE